MPGLYFSFGFASTVLTKQHVLIDVPAGIILAELCVFIISKGWLPEVNRKIFTQFDKIKLKPEYY